MKKRMLCFILALIMVLPLVLVSCNSQSEADRMKEIILGTEGDETERAYTLSLWIPTNKITIEGVTADLSELSQKDRKALQKQNPDIYEFLVRVDAVEEALNKILVSRNYYTHIDIVPVNDKFYEKSIDDRFDSMSANSNPGDMNKRGDSDEYKNDVTEEIVGNSTLYKLLYRPVDRNQLDIFLIRSYDKYVSYINSNYILPLNTLSPIEVSKDGENSITLPATNYITSTGKYYGIYKFIRQEFLNQMKFGEKEFIYALPNNHLYAENYQYILLNKDLLSKYEGVIDIENAENYSDMLAQIKAFVEFSATQTDVNGNNYQGLIAGPTDAPSYIFESKDNMFGGQLGSDKINFAYGDADFVNYVSMYKELVKNGLASSEVREGSSAAVQIVNTTSKEILNLKDDYEIITTKVPVTTRDEIFSSMFAISTFSVDFDRSMKILYLLQTDSEIRTLIQYGIEKEDYNILTLEDDKKNEYEVISLRDTAYKNAFEVMYTGNSYYTYPSDNSKIDDWDYVKNTNLDVTVGQYFPIDAYIKYKAELSDDEKAVLSNYDSVLALIVKTNALIEQMTYEEFLSFQEVYKHDILSIINRINVEIPADIELKQAYLLENQKLFDEIQAKIDEKLPEYETLNKALEEKKAKRDELTEQRDLLESDSDNYEANMEEIERLNTEINTLKQEIKELNNQINALGISALQNEQMTYQIRVTSTQKDIDDLVTELNETLPNLLIELKEASPAAYELKTSEEFAILSKLYNKSYNAIKPKE